jgi:hypothetical protein
MVMIDDDDDDDVFYVVCLLPIFYIQHVEYVFFVTQRRKDLIAPGSLP